MGILCRLVDKSRSQAFEFIRILVPRISLETKIGGSASLVLRVKCKMSVLDIKSF